MLNQNEKKLNILIAAMQMGIGGAETHVLELVRSLISFGHRVTVVSAGGVLVNDIEKAGARHIVIPLNSKSPKNVIKSYIALKKLIKKERFDIVHAHARIPAYICGILHKKLKFKYVTTAHWVFEVNRLWKRISDWGQKTLAVSEDIKQYLIDNYNVFPDNISVTINGINTNFFSPDHVFAEVIPELGLEESKHRVVCVSRMDESRGEAPKLLSRAAEAILGRFPDAQFIFVGGNTIQNEESVLPEIKETALRLNSEYGRNVIVCTGPVSDVWRYVSVSDLFVGVSRAALEAMSAGKPVILAGNEGYLGLFRPEIYKAAAETNFCCRGTGATTEDKLYNDICAAFEAPEALAAAGRFGRNTVLEHYSADRTAIDTLALYESVTLPAKKPDIIISGYYGYGNLGDDSLLISILALLRENGVENVCVLSAHRKRMQRLLGVKCISRVNIFAIIHAMRRSRLLIFGGGNLLQDSTSRKSLFYYLTIIALAQKLKLKTMLYANGIGPLITKEGRNLTARVLKKVDLITLREVDSLSLLHKIGVRGVKTKITSDPALLLTPASVARADLVMAKAGIPSGRRYIAVSLRNFVSGNNQEAFEKELVFGLLAFCEKNDVYPIFIPMHTAVDEPVCRRAAQSCGGAVLSSLTPSELITILSRCSVVLGMRLHILIYALHACVPMVGISYDPKVNAFLSWSGLCAPVLTPSFDRELLCRTLEEALNTTKEDKIKIAASLARLKELARRDGEYAAEFIKRD